MLPHRTRQCSDRQYVPDISTHGDNQCSQTLQALFGLRTELELTGNRYSFASAIFYLGFIVGAYPAMYLAQRWPIERVASAITTVWGVTLITTPACTNFQGLYAQRFFLGLTEAGISPMFMMIVGSWYKKDEQALRMGVWYCCTGYVSIFVSSSLPLIP